jgi:integrase/recombinase XerD
LQIIGKTWDLQTNKNLSVMPASLSIILDIRRIKQKINKYPVKLRVTYQRKSKLYCTVFNLSEEEFDKLNAPNVGAGLKDIWNKLWDIERDADNVIRSMTAFHFDDFEKEFISDHPLFSQKGSITVQGVYGYDVAQYAHRFPIFKEETMPAGTILVTFRAYIDKLLRADRIGTAVCYQTSYYALEKFRGNVLFSEVTVDYLNDFERWMLRKNYSKTTIGIYVRSLRCIFNEVIEDESSSVTVIRSAAADIKSQRREISRKLSRWKTCPKSIITNRFAKRNNGPRVSGSFPIWATA